MGEARKRLRVSIGDFSCELEGFDDPVGALGGVLAHLAGGHASGLFGGAALPPAGAVLAAAAAEADADPIAEGDGGFGSPAAWGGATEAAEAVAAGGDEEPEAVGEAGWDADDADDLDADWDADDEADDEADWDEDAEDGDEEGTEGESHLHRLAAALRAPLPPPEETYARALGELVPEVVATPAEPAAEGHDWEADDGADEETDGGADDRAGEDAVEDAEPDPWVRAREMAAALAGRAGGLSLAELLGGEPADRRQVIETAPDEEAIEALLETAEDRFSDPDAARRRDAVSALKAAVAQAQAERAETGEDAGDGADPFRDAWVEASRAGGAGPGRGPTPLRLVASQRVDIPRRGAARAPTPPAPPPVAPPPAAEPVALPFARFAAEAGAHGLEDLVEAAAAWMAVARREAEPSRAELLRLVAEAMPEPPAREDGLRVFGTLLREGRLERTEGGRVRLARATRFAGAVAAG